MSIPRANPNWLPEVKKSHRLIYKNWVLDVEHGETFRGCCERLNRFLECRNQLEREGLTFTTKNGQIKANPLLSEQKNAWAGYLSGMRLLEFEPADEKKPPHRPPKAPGDY